MFYVRYALRSRVWCVDNVCRVLTLRVVSNVLFSTCFLKPIYSNMQLKIDDKFEIRRCNLCVIILMAKHLVKVGR